MCEKRTDKSRNALGLLGKGRDRTRGKIGWHGPVTLRGPEDPTRKESGAATAPERSVAKPTMMTGTDKFGVMTAGKRAKLGSRLWREASGQELLEMAFVLALLMMLLVGIFWAGRAYNVYTTINRAAREGARVAVAPSCATCGNAFPTAATIQATVDGVLAGSNLLTSSSGSVTITISQHQALGLDPYNASANWTVVSIAYPFHFYVPFVPASDSTVTITSQAQMLEEGS